MLSAPRCLRCCVLGGGANYHEPRGPVEPRDAGTNASASDDPADETERSPVVASTPPLSTLMNAERQCKMPFQFICMAPRKPLRAEPLVTGRAAHEMLAAVAGATEAERQRFLASCDGDPQAAANALRQHLEWRRRTLPRPQHELGLAQWIYLHGEARDGTPIMVVNPARYDQDAGSPEEQVMAFVGRVDAACPRDSLAKFTVLVDCRPGPEEAGWPNPPPWTMLPFVRVGGASIAANFPERVRRLVAYPAPWFGLRIFEAIQPFIDPTTAAKVVLLEGPAYADSPCPAELNEYVSLQNIREDRRPQHACLKDDAVPVAVT